MKRVPSAVWALLILGTFYLFFEYGIAPITGVLTDTAAPLPSSLVLMYTTMAAIGILVYLSVQEERWETFVGPVGWFLGNRGVPSTQRRTARRVVPCVLPPVAGLRACVGPAGPPAPPADAPASRGDRRMGNRRLPRSA